MAPAHATSFFVLGGIAGRVNNNIWGVLGSSSLILGPFLNSTFPGSLSRVATQPLGLEPEPAASPPCAAVAIAHYAVDYRSITNLLLRTESRSSMWSKEACRLLQPCRRMLR